MVKASGYIGVELITSLANQIIKDGAIPSEWQSSVIVNCFKGKGDALERGNYRGLKLVDQVMKVIERVIDKLLRERIDIDKMQFGFVPGRGTTDAIFLLRQLQEKYLGKRKNLYFAFVDLEKAFDRVPRKVIWWAMRKLGVDEWLVTMVQSMYSNARSRVRINDSLSDEFSVNVGVHQGSVLSPLLFILVLEALSMEFRTGCPWELLYADDLVLIAESMEELVEKFEKWKKGLEEKGLKVNTAKSKVMISSIAAKCDLVVGKWPCGVCRKGVGSNSIFCQTCKHWVHKKCSSISGRLRAGIQFVCKRCKGEIIENEVFPALMMYNSGSLEIVKNFCYLGDMLGSEGGVGRSVTCRIGSAWKKFRELLPLLTSRVLSIEVKGKLYEACVRSVMLYGSETWAVKQEDLDRLERNDMRMVRWMCKASLRDRKSSDELRSRLSLCRIKDVIQIRRLNWLGHLERMEEDNWVRKCRDLIVPGAKPRGRPRKTWQEVIRTDLIERKLSLDLTQSRSDWKRVINIPYFGHVEKEVKIERVAIPVDARSSCLGFTI
ncbi:uncharacterized protein LOC130655471 [Hydractinia symbiolongicarpus]|uniref:uncharacterized protein LOC130655471 n=1 Tax=Hydractinia symbiolongicarpus TaxID=13093 RepID=UPI0025518FE1|nr:uncharacterized protein LOC130655471 [Hydractinia symbiolongicarpus]